MNNLLSSDFKGDWYGWLTNQWSHCLLGMMVYSCVMFASIYFGEFASRAFTLICILVGYSVWEIATNTLRSWWDSIEDSIFVCVYGAGGLAITFKEVSGGSDLVLGNVNDVLPIFGLFVFHTVIGVLLRLGRS